MFKCWDFKTLTSFFFFCWGGGQGHDDKKKSELAGSENQYGFFSTLIFLYNMGNSLEMFIVHLMPPDKSVGAGLRTLVCVFQFYILTTDVRRTTTILRRLTRRLVVTLFYTVMLLLSK